MLWSFPKFSGAAFIIHQGSSQHAGAQRDGAWCWVSAWCCTALLGWDILVLWLPPVMPCVLGAQWLLLLEVPISVLFSFMPLLQSNAWGERGKRRKKTTKMHHHISSALLNTDVKSKASAAAPVICKVGTYLWALAVAMLCWSPFLFVLSDVCSIHPQLLKELLSWQFLTCSTNIVLAASQSCIRHLMLPLTAFLLYVNTHKYWGKPSDWMQGLH